jgi:ABC-type bacteriocin/lantibiotic exporter with double-glycine peptidase domain
MARVGAVFCVLCALLAAATPSGIWLDVPFVKQEKEGCGAASIAMVMQYWLQQRGKSALEAETAVNAPEIQRALYSKAGHGIYASDLEQYFQQRGFRTFAFRGEWTDLKQHLEKGRPLIVALKPAAGGALHYVVVTGLDWDGKLVIVNDPAQRKLLKQDQASFEREWSAAGRWTLLALPRPEAH